MDYSNVGKFVAIVRNLIRGEHYYISLLVVKFTRDISVMLFFITIIRIIMITITMITVYLHHFRAV